MIIPVRCFTCGKVLANKYEYYVDEVRKLDEAAAKRVKKTTNEDDSTARALSFFSDNHQKSILDSLDLAQCCRRVMLGHVDLWKLI